MHGRPVQAGAQYWLLRNSETSPNGALRLLLPQILNSHHQRCQRRSRDGMYFDFGTCLHRKRRTATTFKIQSMGLYIYIYSIFVVRDGIHDLIFVELPTSALYFPPSCFLDRPAVDGFFSTLHVFLTLTTCSECLERSQECFTSG